MEAQSRERHRGHHDRSCSIDYEAEHKALEAAVQAYGDFLANAGSAEVGTIDGGSSWHSTNRRPQSRFLTMRSSSTGRDTDASHAA